MSGHSIISHEAVVLVPSEFKDNGKTMSVKLTNFCDKPFDCILGNSILTPIGAIIDLLNNKLIVNGNEIIIRRENEAPFRYEEVCYLEKDENDINNLIHKDLNMEEKDKLRSFLYKNSKTFYKEGQDLSATNCVRHKIITTSHQPIYSKNYRCPQIHEKEIERQIEEMLNQGIIRPSNSPYNSPLWVVPKGSDSKEKKWRIVIDYRNLNKVTIDDKFPMPNIESLFDKLGRANYFSTLDLAKGFHQILMEESDIEKTAFSTPMGLFEYIRMPFGLKNAPATFQRLMNHVLRDFVNKSCVIYMDDILIFSTSLSEHFETLTKIFKKLNEYNLKVQMSKCQFLAKQTEFLGHIVSSEGIKPNPTKINAINKVGLPKTIKQIRSFLGLTGYYRKFIQNYSMIGSPIIKYLKKGACMKQIEMDNEYIEAFEKLKKLITTYPILAFPNFDKKFTLTTDASNLAIGAVLSQEGKPVCYASRTLNGHEKNYSTLEKELLAIVWAVKYFRPYLFGRKFLVQTDHQPLKWLYSLKDPNQRIIRWKISLGEYEFDVEYLKGKDNKVADFLSRIEESEGNFNLDSIFQISDEVIEIESDNCDDQLLSSTGATIHSSPEDLNDHFLISEGIVNKYRTQIRIVKTKNSEIEFCFRKYKIIYIEENDLSRDHYLNDLFRNHLRNGKIGIYSELNDQKYNIIQQKLINLFNNDAKIKFIKCTKLATDLINEEQLYSEIEKVHLNTNHRGVLENFEEIKNKFFCPNLIKFINRFINNCVTCAENKYDRKPIKKFFNATETPNKPNVIVHMDIFQIHKTYFLTTIDRFTKLASVHKINDKNMLTVKMKLEERISYLGKPETLIMDNEFNNTLIKFFCREKGITTHFTTPNSHTGNSDIERFHSTLLEHIRVLKRSDENMGIEELVIRSVGFYNNSIHSTIKVKPMDFINHEEIDLNKIALNMQERKKKAIDRINAKREPVPNFNVPNLFIKNPKAVRQKTEKRYNKFNPSNPNKIDITQMRRPLKNISFLDNDLRNTSGNHNAYNHIGVPPSSTNNGQ